MSSVDKNVAAWSPEFLKALKPTKTLPGLQPNPAAPGSEDSLLAGNYSQNSFQLVNNTSLNFAKLAMNQALQESLFQGLTPAKAPLASQIATLNASSIQSPVSRKKEDDRNLSTLNPEEPEEDGNPFAIFGKNVFNLQKIAANLPKPLESQIFDQKMAFYHLQSSVMGEQLSGFLPGGVQLSA